MNRAKSKMFCKSKSNIILDSLGNFYFWKKPEEKDSKWSVVSCKAKGPQRSELKLDR